MIKKCEKCDGKFTYKEIMKATLSSYGCCKNCNEQYGISVVTRILLSLLIVLPFFFIIY
jgi:CXXC-20-CXXC protein